MKVWEGKQVIDFDQSTATVKEERNKTLQQQMTDKYNRFRVVTVRWGPNIQVWTCLGIPVKWEEEDQVWDQKDPQVNKFKQVQVVLT